MKKPKTQQGKDKDKTTKSSAQLLKEITKAEGIISAIGDGISIMDRTFKILYENQVHRDIFGDHVGEHCYKVYQKRQGVCGGCPVALTFKDEKVHIVQTEVKTEEETRYFEITASPLKDSKGKIIAGIEVVRDLTERKKAEVELRESEERYRSLFEKSPDPILLINKDGNYFDGNKAALQFLECTLNELLAKNVGDFIPPGNKTEVLEEHKPLWFSGGYKETEYYVHGNIKILELVICPTTWKGKQVVFGMGRDITERKRVEETLKDSEKQYRLLFNGITDAVYVHEVAVEKPGKFIAVNDSACRMLGYTMDEFLQMEVKEIDIPEQSEKIPSIQEKLFRDGYALFETCHVAKNGRRIPVEINIQLVEVQGKSMVLSVARDITERKHAEKALQASEDKFHSLFNQAADLIAILDLQGNFIDLNRRFEEESRWSREEMIGRNVLTSGIVTEESSRHISFYLNQLIQGKEIPMFEIEGVIKDGGTVPYEIRATHIRKEGKTVAIQAILRNITERKQAIKAVEILREQNLQILQSAGEGILGLDKEGKHTFANPSAAKMLGYTSDEIIGTYSHKTWHHTKLNGTLYPENECPILKSLQDGSIQTVDDELFWKKDGTRFPVEYTSTPIEENGKIIGAVVTFRDITERRHMEEEIQKRVEDLQAFYEMAIGRELRMKELKEKIIELTEKLAKYEQFDD